MRWIGASIGAFLGANRGGLLGGVIGAVVGNWLEAKVRNGLGKGGSQGKDDAAVGGEFATLAALSAILSKMAKADGRISASEVRYCERVFDMVGLRGAKREYCIRVFQRTKDDSHSIYEYADSFTLIQPSIHVREVVYGLLWDLACIDNTLSQAELDILRAIVRNLRINPALFEWEARRRGVATGAAEGVASEEDPYEVIGCCGNASNEELRSAYREKAKQLHPDVLKAQGLSEELMSRANAQMSRINAAWAKIKKERRL